MFCNTRVVFIPIEILFRIDTTIPVSSKLGHRQGRDNNSTIFVHFGAAMFGVTFAFFLGTCFAKLAASASLHDRDVIVGIEGLNSTNDLESKQPLYYMNDNCHKNVRFSTREQARFAPWSTKYPPSNTECLVRVTQAHYPDYKYVVTFKTMQMSSSSSGGNCVHSRLDLYSGTMPTASKLISGPDGICGKKSAFQEYTTDSNQITLRFTTSGLKPRTYEFFEAVLTPYHVVGTCRHDEFKCKNGRCVKNDLLCNGYNNCGDDSDEKSCAALLLSVAAIAGIVVGCVVIIGIICSIVICKCCCGACGYERL